MPRGWYAGNKAVDLAITNAVGTYDAILMYTDQIAGSDLFVPVYQLNAWGDASILTERTIPANSPVGMEAYAVTGRITQAASAQLVMSKVRDANGLVLSPPGAFCYAAVSPAMLGDRMIFTDWSGESADLGRGSAHGADDGVMIALTGGTYQVCITLSGPVS